ncbi:M48 family metalloprotease [Myxococcota bacterium]|nr:M48 family metalloprotease [Myxococcota bacterium]
MSRRWCPVLLVLLAACADSDTESWLIDESQEIQMGSEFHQQLLAEMPAYTRDQRVTRYLENMGREMAARTTRPNLPWTFTVVESDEINAFAVMGGYIYVTTGLLKAASSGAEVATVVAHELGHVTARHGVRQMEIFLIEQNIVDLLFQSESTRQLVSQAIQTVSVLTFSKDQEREADSLGVQIAADASWNPWGIVDFFSYLQEIDGGGSGGGILSGIGELFSTHPPTTERISNVEQQLGSLRIGRDAPGYRWGTVSDDAEFAAMKSALSLP